MSNVVYWYSATGNSLSFARSLAEGLGGTEMLSMPKSIGGTAHARAERVGLVFPVHVWGPPRIAVDFMNRLKVSDNQYVFAIATCGGCPANTLFEVRDLLRRNGGHLDAGFAVRDTAYFQGGSQGLVGLVSRAAYGVQPGLGSDRLGEITDAVRAKRKLEPEASPWGARVLGSMFRGMCARMMPKADKSFRVGVSCDGCGICERVCPRANVKIVAGKPRWSGNCQMCQACFLWCPQGAIQFGTTVQSRSHRDGVTLGDMLVR